MYIKHNCDAHFCYYLNGPINQYGITETQLSMTAKLHYVNKIEINYVKKHKPRVIELSIFLKR